MWSKTNIYICLDTILSSLYITEEQRQNSKLSQSNENEEFKFSVILCKPKKLVKLIHALLQHYSIWALLSLLLFLFYLVSLLFIDSIV